MKIGQPSVNGVINAFLKVEKEEASIVLNLRHGAAGQTDCTERNNFFGWSTLCVCSRQASELAILLLNEARPVLFRDTLPDLHIASDGVEDHVQSRLGDDTN